jgi:hypothetical protein
MFCEYIHLEFCKCINIICISVSANYLPGSDIKFRSKGSIFKSYFTGDVEKYAVFAGVSKSKHRKIDSRELYYFKNICTLI